MKAAEHLQKLIKSWLEYSENNSSYSLTDFARWLLVKHENDDTEISIEETRGLQEKKMQLGFLFGRLSNFVDLWGKVAFKDIPLRSFEDYGIIKEVQYKVSPSKNELAESLVNEKSTAFEIIKRLVRDGLLSEQIDEKDKRIRRVSLTKKGMEISEKADEQAMKVALLLVGHSTEAEIDDLLKKFSELNGFHSGKYSGEWESIDDLL